METLKIMDGVLVECLNKDLKRIVIPNSVTSIGDRAFRGCTALTSVTIPDSVKSIGEDAFYGCSSLTSITIPDSVTSIGGGAFCWCSALKNVTIGNGVKSIGEDAFYDCSALTSVSIPDSVTSIGKYAFNYCSSLTSITIPDGVTSIGDWTFYGCSSLTSITIPDSVTSIGNYAFGGCSSLTSVTIGKGVTSIGSYAFYGCSSLTSVSIPDSVKSIGNYAFKDCYKLVEVYNLSSLSITMGSSANGYVGYYAKNIYTLESGESKLTYTDDGFIFYSDGDTIYLLGYTGTETALTLPENFNGKNYAIYEYAFNNCSSLISIAIPDSVTSIGRNTFVFCSSLTSVTIGNGVTHIGEGVFYRCDNLKSQVKNYKAFDLENGNLSCRCTSFSPKEWSDQIDDIELCRRGYHYCTNLFDIFNYYFGEIDKDIAIYECDVGDVTYSREGRDSKHVTNKIKPVKRLYREDIIRILNGQD